VLLDVLYVRLTGHCPYGLPVLNVVQERSRVSPAIRGRVRPSPNFLKSIFDLKMASFYAFIIGGILCDLEL